MATREPPPDGEPLASRRDLFCSLAALTGLAVAMAAGQVGASPERARFIAEAERMRREAVARGDQSYGAILVVEGAIAGWGPSRVVTDRNPDAHAERVALWDAQRRLGRERLDGAVMYSTSRPCAACQRALAGAGIARLFFGPEGTDGGAPAPG
jgi:tRNA(Arg) A34 adenosine deaminase TadA